jgi:transcriptional repressor NrdR
MRCPRCGHTEDQVIDSRPGKGAEEIRRRRECLSCGFRFTTYERVELQLPVIVKRDGRREPFNREKIRSGLSAACQKRAVATETVQQILERIEGDLVSTGLAEVPSARIGDAVMNALRELDKVAYLRFASVYLSFETLSEFAREVARVEHEET